MQLYSHHTNCFLLFLCSFLIIYLLYFELQRFTMADKVQKIYSHMMHCMNGGHFLSFSTRQKHWVFLLSLIIYTVCFLVRCLFWYAIHAFLYTVTQHVHFPSFFLFFAWTFSFIFFSAKHYCSSLKKKFFYRNNYHSVVVLQRLPIPPPPPPPPLE